MDEGHPGLGYEGAHIYKINGKYYVFLIHSARNEWKRIQACFVSDSLQGEFIGGDVLNDDMGYFNSGVAQGGLLIHQMVNGMQYYFKIGLPLVVFLYLFL